MVDGGAPPRTGLLGKTLKYGNKKLKTVNNQLQVQIGLKEADREIDQYGKDMAVVRFRQQLRVGSRVVTLKHPSSSYQYGKLSIYHNKPAEVVAFPPGNKLIRLRFEDGTLANWMFEDVKVHPTQMADYTEPRLPLNLVYPKGTSGDQPTVQWMDPENPPPLQPSVSKTPSQATNSHAASRRGSNGSRSSLKQTGRDTTEDMLQKRKHRAQVDDPLDRSEDNIARDDDPFAEAIRRGDWVEGTDPKTGRCYWWNAETRATTWDLRALLGVRSEDEVPPYFPEKMICVCRATHGPVYAVGGTYRRQGGEVNGMPFWYCPSANRWLFSTATKHWALTDSREDFFDTESAGTNKAMVISSSPHNTKYPPGHDTEWVAVEGVEPLDITMDSYVADGAHFFFDVFYILHAPRQAGKAGQLADGVHSGAYTISKALKKLCASYQVDHEEWAQDPPQAVVKYVLMRYLQAMHIDRATWGHTDSIAGRVTGPNSLNREMVKLCLKTGGDPALWTGPYPRALRYPSMSQSAIKFRVEALKAVEGRANVQHVDTDEVVERVVSGGERFDSVMTQCCTALGVDAYEQWTVDMPRGLVVWTISTFFNTYDPDGSGGEAEPIAQDVTSGKYTLDHVMTQLCSRWRDRGATTALWTGEFPEAMRRIVKHGVSPGDNPILALKAKRRLRSESMLSLGAGPGGSGKISTDEEEEVFLREAIDTAVFKLSAFQAMHSVPDTVHPMDQLEHVKRGAASAKQFNERMDGVFQEYMRLCNIRSQHRYLWVGNDAPAASRYRFDAIIDRHLANTPSGSTTSPAASLPQAEARRDELLARLAHKEMTLDEAIESFCSDLRGCPASDWVGPFPKAMRGPGAFPHHFPEVPPPPEKMSLASQGSARGQLHQPQKQKQQQKEEEEGLIPEGASREEGGERTPTAQLQGRSGSPGSATSSPPESSLKLHSYVHTVTPPPPSEGSAASSNSAILGRGAGRSGQQQQQQQSSTATRGGGLRSGASPPARQVRLVSPKSMPMVEGEEEEGVQQQPGPRVPQLPTVSDLSALAGSIAAERLPQPQPRRHPASAPLPGGGGTPLFFTAAAPSPTASPAPSPAPVPPGGVGGVGVGGGGGGRRRTEDSAPRPSVRAPFTVVTPSSPAPSGRHAGFSSAAQPVSGGGSSVGPRVVLPPGVPFGQSRVGKAFQNHVAFTLNVFHEVHHLPFTRIQFWAEQVMSSGDPVAQFDSTMQNLCSKSQVDAAPWCGARPSAVYTYILEEFFSVYDPASMAEVSGLVAVACSPLSSIAIVVQQLCEGYGVPKDYWSGEYPLYFKKKAEASRNRVQHMGSARKRDGPPAVSPSASVGVTPPPLGGARSASGGAVVAAGPGADVVPVSPVDPLAGSKVAHLMHLL